MLPQHMGQKMLLLSLKVDVLKPLLRGPLPVPQCIVDDVVGRDLHSFRLQPYLSCSVHRVTQLNS
jgi:hypothetical protein